MFVVARSSRDGTRIETRCDGAVSFGHSFLSSFTHEDGFEVVHHGSGSGHRVVYADTFDKAPFSVQITVLFEI